MNESIRRNRVPNLEYIPGRDETLIGNLKLKNSTKLTVGTLANMLEKKDITVQVEMATKLLVGGKFESDIDPRLILRAITNEKARKQVELWCHGVHIEIETIDEKKRGDKTEKIKNVRVLDDEDSDNEIHPLLKEEEELIAALEPFIRPSGLAQVIATVQGYRTSDSNINNTLVNGIYRLSSQYLGVRRRLRRDRQEPRPLILPPLSGLLSKGKIIEDILRESLNDDLFLPQFMKGEDHGRRYVEELLTNAQDDVESTFFESLQDHWKNVYQLQFPRFKQFIAGNQRDLPKDQRTQEHPFPAAHQREIAHWFVTKKKEPMKAMIAGETGTMKTGGILACLEAANANTSIIVCPAGVRESWVSEIREIYASPVDIVRIQEETQFQDLISKPLPAVDRRIIVVSYELLSRLDPAAATLLMRKFSRACNIDSLGFDEAQLIKNPDANCSQQLFALSNALPKEAPRIGASATLLINSVEDLDSEFRMLIPHEFANKGEFTRAARNDPYAVKAEIQARQLLKRWHADTILEELPPIEFKDVPVPLSPFHQAVYEWVYFDDTIMEDEAQRILRQAALDPLIIRKYYYPKSLETEKARQYDRLSKIEDEKKRSEREEKIKALDERKERIIGLFTPYQAQQELQKAHLSYMEWISAQGSSEPFDEDFLCRFGYENLSVWAFLTIPGGVNDLIKTIPDPVLKQDWQGMEIYSSKIKMLKTKLDEETQKGSRKQIIYSAFYKEQVTTGMEDWSDDDDLAAPTVYDWLRLWYGEESVLKIDGTVPLDGRQGQLSPREQVRRSWRMDPQKKYLLTNLPSSKLGIDLTSLDPTTHHYAVHSLDRPDTYADVAQGIIGRVKRKGQRFPATIYSYMATHNEFPQTVRYGFIDTGLQEKIEHKQLLDRMALDTEPLTQAEERLMRERLNTVKVTELYPQTPNRYMNEVLFNKVRGQGYAKVREIYNQEGFEGQTNAEFFANYYAYNEERSIAGHNARLVSELIKHYQTLTGKSSLCIGSVGSGPDVIGRALDTSVINMDMLFQILEMGKFLHNGTGEYVLAEAAHLPIQSEIFDVLDLSFMLHWTNNKHLAPSPKGLITERERVIREVSRTSKTGALISISVPHTYFTPEQFTIWKSVITSPESGFRLHPDIASGMVHATDFRLEALSWVLNLEKVEDIHPDFSARLLNFDFERGIDIIRPVEKRNRRGDVSIINKHPIPHSNFAITDPTTQTDQLYTYVDPVTRKMEEFILSENEGKKQKPYTQESDLIRYGSIAYEVGQYNRLFRYLKSKYKLEGAEAQQLAIEALNIWEEQGSQRTNSQKIFHELVFIVNNLKQTYDTRKTSSSGAGSSTS